MNEIDDLTVENAIIDCYQIWEETGRVEDCVRRYPGLEDEIRAHLGLLTELSAAPVEDAGEALVRGNLPGFLNVVEAKAAAAVAASRRRRRWLPFIVVGATFAFGIAGASAAGIVDPPAVVRDAFDELGAVADSGRLPDEDAEEPRNTGGLPLIGSSSTPAGAAVCHGCAADQSTEDSNGAPASPDNTEPESTRAAAEQSDQGRAVASDAESATNPAPRAIERAAQPAAAPEADVVNSGGPLKAPGDDGTPPGLLEGPPGNSGNAPGLEGTPPGQGGTPPEQDGTPPGNSDDTPGQGGIPPGQDGTQPGQGGTPPGQPEGPLGNSGITPGDGGTPPGQGGTLPGQPGDPPGNSGNTPGHGGTPPGQDDTPPGQSEDPPGNSGNAPGHGGTPPGQGGTPPGQTEDPPGISGTAPGFGGIPSSEGGTTPGQSNDSPGNSSNPPVQGGTPPGLSKN